MIRLIVLLGVAVPANASVEDDFGLGSRATALGGAFTAVADDVTAIHYNPAAIAAFPRWLPPDEGRAGLHTHVGFLHAAPSLWLERGTLGGGGLRYEARRDYDTPSASGVTLGAVADLDPVAVGLLLYLPVQRFYAWETPTAEQVQWPMYDDRTQHLSILPSVAWRPLDGLTVGAGLRVVPSVRTDTVVRSSGIGEEENTSGERATMNGRVAPTFGVHYEPGPWLRLGLVHRRPLYANDHGQTDLTGLAPSAYVHRLAHYYMPTQWVVGVAARLEEAMLTVDVAHLAWSGFIDTYTDAHPEVFEDTWVPRAGFAYATPWRTEVLAGYSYVGSPVQDGQVWTNFVDNDKHVLSLGTQTRLFKQFEAKRSPIDLAWHAQLHLLRERRFVKDWRGAESVEAWRQNPGSPALRSGGHVLNLGLTLTVGL